MTVQEMHSSVMQGVDKINAQVADTLLSNEIDRELNKAIQVFVTTRFQQNNRLQQGFEETQKRRDDLRTLIREYESNASFKEEFRGPTHPEGPVFVDTWEIPEDYMHLINILTVINRLPDCTKISYELKDQDEIAFFVLPWDFLTNNGTKYLNEIWFVNDIDADWAGDDWEGFQMWSCPDDFLNTVPTSLNQQDFVNEFENGWLENIPFFWEKWDPMTMANMFNVVNVESYIYPNSVLIPVDVESEQFPDFGINVDPSVGPLSHIVGRYNNTTVSFAPIKFNADIAHRRVPATMDFIRERNSCRLVQHDDIFKLIEDPFNKTKYSSPLTVMRDKRLDIYSDDTFITDKVRITYLKRPEIVDLGNQVNCDLPESTHEEICKLAVLSILEEISDPRYNSHLSQVDKME